MVAGHIKRGETYYSVENRGKFGNSEKLKFTFLFTTVARKSYIH